MQHHVRVDENLKVGKVLPGTFSIKQDSAIAVATIDQTSGEEQRRLWEQGGNIVQFGSKTFVTLRVFEKVNVELNEPWGDKEVENLCSCIWNKFPEGRWERDEMRRIFKGGDPNLKTKGVLPRMGKAMKVCGGYEL